MKASSHMEDRLEKILHLLCDLASESARGIPILVEGRKDAEALNELEIKGDIIAVKAGGGTISDMLNEVQERSTDEAILLMDFDRRGRELTRYLTQCLEKMRIKPNTVIWKELLSLLRKDIKDIEGLPGCIETLKEKTRKKQNSI